MQVVSEFLEITISDAISLVLSALLVLLYWKMYQIQSEQKQVLESHDDALNQQADIMSVEYQPDIRCEMITADGDTLHTLLSNDGRGAADALQAKCAIYGHLQQNDEEDQFEPVSLKRGEIVINTHYVPLYSTSESGNHHDGDRSRKIQSGEAGWFNAEIKMLVNEDEIRPFSEVIRMLSTDWRVEQIAFDFYVGSLDDLDRQHVAVAGSYRNVPLEPMTLEDALERGEESKPIHMSVDDVAYPATKIFDKSNV